MSQTRPTNTELAASIGHLSKSLDAFVKVSEKQQTEHRAELDKLWTAHTEQGDKMTAALDRISNRGRITMPAIFTAVGVLVAVIGGACSLLKTHIELRVQKVEELSALRADKEAEISGLRAEGVRRDLDRIAAKDSSLKTEH